MTKSLSFVVTVALAATLSAQTSSPQGGGANAQVSYPKPTAKTPGSCLAEVRDYVAGRQKTMTPPAAGMTPSELTQARVAAQQLNAAKLAMTKECAARFDVKTTADADLDALVSLNLDANLIDQAKAASDRELGLAGRSPADRAAALISGIAVVRRSSPPNVTRPWRVANMYPKVEMMIDELEANPAATFDQKWTLHTSMEGTYRGDDIDAGIIKHGNWILAAAKRFSADDKKKYGSYVVSAHVNMAEAYAGQAMNDKAIALLKAAKADWPDVPNLSERVDPTLHRYELVGTSGAAVVAPVWLNSPAGTASLAMPGHVTLLEFTAHWCGPCRESYPGINRLRQRFAGTAFRVAMVTRLWSYFGTERDLAADAEIAHDRDYFAEHKLDVPVAIAPLVSVSVVDGKVVYKPGPDPNDTAYGVGGIPQIQLIDKAGHIRLIMVGYDSTNEEKLAGLIETMLKEK
jgi:thiol-disulfide isomerase/thioredoxin